MGFKFLNINPMVASDTQVFAEGVEAGFLASDEEGEPIELEFPFGEPPAYYDMTVEGSLDWFWGYLGRAADKGIDGWMHDYGESLPLEAVMGDGRSGYEVHNEYPLLWAEAGRAFWEMKRPDGDFAIFNRSGYTGISAHTHIMWLGDQLVTFDRNDGLGSVPRLYLSAGLSGIALTHSDIGGYWFWLVRAHLRALGAMGDFGNVYALYANPSLGNTRAESPMVFQRRYAAALSRLWSMAPAIVALLDASGRWRRLPRAHLRFGPFGGTSKIQLRGSKWMMRF